MQAIKYTGAAHMRVIRPEDLATVGFDYPDVLVFDSQDLVTRGQAIVDNDEIAEWLVAHDSFVRVEGMEAAPKLRALLSEAPAEQESVVVENDAEVVAIETAESSEPTN